VAVKLSRHYLMIFHNIGPKATWYSCLLQFQWTH